MCYYDIQELDRKLNQLRNQLPCVNKVLYTTTALTGAVIGCYYIGVDNTTGALYYRDASGDWQAVPGGGSPVNIYNTDGALTANRALTGANHSLTITGLSTFGVTSGGDANLTSTFGNIHLQAPLDISLLSTGSGNLALTATGGEIQFTSGLAFTLNGAPGTSGQVFTSQGTGFPPIWTTPSGSGTVTNVSSANGDITIATATTTPVLTLNSGSGANQIVKRDGSGHINATTVTTNANLTGDVTSVGNASTYSNVVPAAKGGAGSVSGILKANGSGTVSAATAGTDYQVPITLTTTGSSGAATFSGGTLNIPNYAGGGGGTPAGSDTQIQFNNTGAFGANSNFVYDYTNDRVGIGTTTPGYILDVAASALHKGAKIGISTPFRGGGANTLAITGDGLYAETPVEISNSASNANPHINFYANVNVGLEIGNLGLGYGGIAVGSLPNAGLSYLEAFNSAVYTPLYINGINVYVGDSTNGHIGTQTSTSGFYVGDQTNFPKTQAASAIVQLESTVQGFLPPVMTTAQMNAIVSPAVGLIVYVTDLVEGVYANKSGGWTFIG